MSGIATGESIPFLHGHLERLRLDNGLTVLFFEDTRAPVFAFQTWIRAGSRDDPDGRSGLAHLFEHLMFKATATHSEGEFLRRLEAHGSPDVNAWTWNDQTVYLQSLPAGHLDVVAALEADRLRHLALTPETFETERQIVLAERGSQVDTDPYGRLNEQLWNLAFPCHPYGRPVIGWRDDLERIDLDACNAFYRSYYQPSNALLVVVGNAPRDELVAMLERHYAPLPSTPVMRPVPAPEPEQAALRTARVPVDAETEILALGVRIPEANHADQPALWLIDRILFGGRSGRLYRRLVDAGIATDVQAFLPTFAASSLYDITVALRPDARADDAQAVIFEAFESLATTPPTDAELTAARRRLEASVYADWREACGIGEWVGLFEIATGDVQRGLDHLARVRTIDPEAIRDVAARLLRPARATAIIGEPTTGAARVGVHGPAGRRRCHLDDAPPPAGAAPVIALAEPSPPLVRTAVVFDAGSALDPEGKEGLAYVTAAMLTRGTRTRDKRAFLEAIEGFGATVDATAGFERIEIGGDTLAETWPDVLALLHEALVEPAFDADEVARLVEELRARLVDARNDDALVATHWHERTLFAGHPYCRPVCGNAASLSRITREDVVAFHRDRLGATGAVAGVAGAIGADAADRVRAVLDALGPRDPIAWDDPPLAPPVGRRVLLVDKPGRTQTRIRIGHRGVTLADPDYPLLELANTVFGAATYRSTLANEIREQRGWSYDVACGFKVAKRPHAFTIAIAPSPVDALPAINRTLELFKRATGEAPATDDLEAARAFLLGASAFDSDTADKRLRLALDRQVLGFDRDAFLARIAAATADDVVGAMARHFNPHGLWITIVATADDLRSKLERHGGFEAIETVAYDAD